MFPRQSQPCLCAPVSPLILWPRGEQCGGCRRSNATDRPHAFQVILADRPCLELSAESEADMADWMQHLCQAVSKGVSSSCLHIHLASRPLPGSPGHPPKHTPVTEPPVSTHTGPQGTSQEAAWSTGPPRAWPPALSLPRLLRLAHLPDLWGEGRRAGWAPGADQPQRAPACLSPPLCQCPSGHPPGGNSQPLHPLLPSDH